MVATDSGTPADRSVDATETPCPGCGVLVEPLRAPAVSVATGRIQHFCGAACRETWMNRRISLSGNAGFESESGHPETLGTGLTTHSTSRDDATGSAPFASIGSSPATDVAGDPQSHRWSWIVFVPFAIELFFLGGTAMGVFLLPPLLGVGLWIPALAGAAIVGFMLFDVLRDLRMQAFRGYCFGPGTAAGLVLLSGLLAVERGDFSSMAFRTAVLIPLVFSVTRFLEVLSRLRSGVVQVSEGRSLRWGLVGWQDNMALSRKLGRLARFLDFGRIPLALGIGFVAGHVVNSPLSDRLLTAAVAILVLNPRFFRGVTRDAVLHLILWAAHRRVRIRDGRALQGLLECRTALLMPAVLWRDPPQMGSFRFGREDSCEGVHEGPEKDALSVLAGIRNGFSDRIRGVIEAFLRSRGCALENGGGVLLRDGEEGGEQEAPDGSVRWGSRQCLLEGLVSTGEHESWAAGEEESGRQVHWISHNDEFLAAFSLEETPAPDAVEAIRRFSRIGLEPAMLTSAPVTAAFAQGNRIGVERVFFGRTDQELPLVLGELSDAGSVVALIGCGHSFAMVASEAHVAICAGENPPEGDAVGVTVEGASLVDIADTIASARRTGRSVRRNLFVVSLAAVAGLSLSVGPISGGLVVAVAVVVGLVELLCTVNGPFRRLDHGVRILRDALRRTARWLGIWRS